MRILTSELTKPEISETIAIFVEDDRAAYALHTDRFQLGQDDVCHLQIFVCKLIQAPLDPCNDDDSAIESTIQGSKASNSGSGVSREV